MQTDSTFAGFGDPGLHGLKVLRGRDGVPVLVAVEGRVPVGPREAAAADGDLVPHRPRDLGPRREFDI